MSLDNLEQRISKMLAHIEQRGSGPESVQSGFHMHLFTEREQASLLFLFSQVEPRITAQDGNVDLRLLTDGELDALRLWFSLQDALEQEDIDAAARYRRILARPQDTRSQEQLITQFLSIAESSIPAFDQAPTVKTKYGSKTLYRTYFRSDKARILQAIARNDGRGIDLETMRLWCDNFPATA